MEDISLHILDIAENSVCAGATRIEIIIAHDRENDLLRVEVVDDGKGMDPATLMKVRDPFFTTKEKRKKTGLGIPLLAQAAEQAGGALSLESAPGRGTRLVATFSWSNMDRPAIGSMTDTLMALIGGHPDVDVVYEEREDSRVFRFDTREINRELNTPEALDALRGRLKKHIKFEI